MDFQTPKNDYLSDEKAKIKPPVGQKSKKTQKKRKNTSLLMEEGPLEDTKKKLNLSVTWGEGEKLN